jgi:ribonuclease R
VRIQVSRVDLDGRKIDFRLVREGEELAAGKPARDKAARDKDPEASAGMSGKKRVTKAQGDDNDAAPRRKRGDTKGTDSSGRTQALSPIQALKAAAKKALGKTKGRKSHRP